MHELFHEMFHSWGISHEIGEVLVGIIENLLITIPILFLAYLLMEYIEHKASSKMENAIAKIGKFGPFLGTGLGLIPQCGFSASCSNLYAASLLTEGTLIAVFIATSDEAIPLLLADSRVTGDIWKFLLVKIVFGIVIGFLVDFTLKVLKIKKKPIEMCKDCGCEEENGIAKSALKHTLKTGAFILVLSIIIDIIMVLVGTENLKIALGSNSIFQPFLTALIGLIPNCSVSVALIELYAEGVISFGSACAGLCSGAGIGLAVLFKTNKSIKENLRIVGILYFASALIGFFLMLLGA